MKKLLLGAIASLALGSAAHAQMTSTAPLEPKSSVASVSASNGVCTYPCAFSGVTAANTSASAVWVLMFDAITVPADGAVTPKEWFQVPANSTWAYTLGGTPSRYLTGLSIACSSSGPFTKAAVASCAFAVRAR